MDAIKVGRKTHTLKDGDAIMDNGSCFQLMKEWPAVNPKISIKAFKEFKDLDCVHEVKKHNYGDTVSIWQYKTNV